MMHQLSDDDKVIIRDDQIIIKKERFKELEESEKKLNALEVAGVDNWEGYEFAIEMMNEE